jgi:hypothetical protein
MFSYMPCWQIHIYIYVIVLNIPYPVHWYVLETMEPLLNLKEEYSCIIQKIKQSENWSK